MSKSAVHHVSAVRFRRSDSPLGTTESIKIGRVEHHIAGDVVLVLESGLFLFFFFCLFFYYLLFVSFVEIISQ